MAKIELVVNKGFRWTKIGKYWYKGYIRYKDNLLDNNSMRELLLDLDIIDFFKLMIEFDGFYTFIFENSDKIYLVSDQIRSFPLFYNVSKTGISVTDNLVVSNQDSFNTQAIEIFESSLFVPGSMTLSKDYFQTEPGQIVTIDKKHFDYSKENYYDFKYKIITYDDKFYILEKIINIFKKSLSQFKHKKIVIPLSGGHDSRLILHFLKYFGFENIITYSYGHSSSKEIKIAEQVASFYNVPFYSILYNNQTHVKINGLYDDYLKFSGNMSSVPCMQEFYAVWYLSNNEIIDNNSIFLPGYTGDFIHGNHIPQLLFDCKTCNPDNFKKLIISKFHSESSRKIKSDLICDSLSKYDLNNDIDRVQAIEYFEDYNYRNRQSKFIVNSVRTFEFFGFSWYLPYFTKEYMDLWLSIDIEQRYKRKLIFEIESLIYKNELPFSNNTTYKKFNRNFNLHLFPRRNNYLFYLFPLAKVYSYTIFKKTSNINQIVKKDYDSSIKTLRKTKILEFISLIILFFIAYPIAHIMYDKKYISTSHFKGKYFNLNAPGWKWTIDDFINRLKSHYNKGVPWPISSKSIVINHKNIYFDPEDISIFQSPNCYFQAINGRIIIGKNVKIGPNVGLITTNHRKDNINLHDDGGFIILLDNVWVGMGSIILKDVFICENSIVGANSTVTHNFYPENSLILNNSAKIKIELTKEDI